ncbi:MAG: hypothetical protein ACK4HQ_09385 [Brevinematales bacterium]
MKTMTIEEFQELELRKRLRRMKKCLKSFVKVVEHVRASEKIDIDYIAITLTYRDIGEYQSSDIRSYMNALSMWCRRNDVKIYGYAWVLEFQRRGVAHYHVLLAVPRGTKVPKPDMSYWPAGMSQVKRLNRVGAGYLAKYMSKMDVEDYRAIQTFLQQRGVTKLRLWAVVMRDHDMKEFYRATKIPAWLEKLNVYLFQKPYVYDTKKSKWCIEGVVISGRLEFINGVVVISSWVEYRGKRCSLDEVFDEVNALIESL